MSWNRLPVTDSDMVELSFSGNNTVFGVRSTLFWIPNYVCFELTNLILFYCGSNT